MRTFLRAALALTLAAGSAVAAHTGPAAASASQMVSINQSITHLATNTGNPTVIDNPADWTSPVNYSQGNAYFRIEVTSKPSSKLTQAQYCLWRHGTTQYQYETCAGTTAEFTDEGVYWVNLGKPANWWKLNGVWDWTKKPDVIQIMFKDKATGKLLMSSRCGSNCYPGTDLAQHVPITAHVSVVIVGQGDTLTPLSNWNGCPSTWGGGCPNVGGPTAPSIQTHPGNQTVTEGQTATFSVVANGTAPLAYQWRKNGDPIPGATNASYTTPPTALADSGATFSVVVSNGVNPSATSNNGVLTVNPAGTTAPWWNSNWDFRVALTSAANSSATTDAPLVVPFNGASLMSQAGGTGVFSPASLRVLEVDGTGNVTDTDVPFQFEPSSGNPLSGELVVIAEGNTAANALRRFHVYFDDTASGHAAATPTALVNTTNGALDQGFTNWRTTTQNGTWVYHKDGGGFAHLFDAGNEDWFSYSTATGSAGDYRGVPNMVHPNDGGYFHPGRNSVVSTLVANGPARTVLKSVSNDNNWEVRWEIYPRYAEMTTVRTNGNHWFLYEGTPGGAIGTEDVTIRSNGTVSPIATTFTGDLAAPEWVLFADQNDDRSFLAAQRVNDSIVDSHYVMENNMTVFGFGRNGNNRFLTGTGREFVVGLVAGDTVGTTASGVNSMLAVLGASLGAPEQDGGGGGGGGSGLVSDAFGGASLGAHWTVVNPAGDGAVSVSGGAARLAVPSATTHDLWPTNRNGLRIVQNANDVDFTVEAQFNAAPTLRTQIEGIVVEAANGDLLRFDLLRGSGLQTFAGYVTASTGTQLHRASHSGSGVVKIKVIRSGSTWTMQVARGAGAFTTVTTLNQPLAVAKVGVWSGNAAPNNPAFTAVVNQFTAA